MAAVFKTCVPLVEAAVAVFGILTDNVVTGQIHGLNGRVFGSNRQQ